MLEQDGARDLMRSALFVFSIVHYYREMMPVARYFRDRGWQVRVIIGWDGSSAKDAAADCRANGLELVEVNPAFLIRSEHGGAVPPAEPSAPGTTSPRAHPFLYRIAMFADSLSKLTRMKRHARALIGTMVPDIVFAGPYHSPDLLHNGIAAVCRVRRIPYCNLPASAYVGEHNSVLGRFLNRRLGMQTSVIDVGYDRLNRLMSHLFPGWTRTRDNVSIFMWDPLLILAARLCGVLVGNIWQKPAESFDVVYVYSEFSRKMLAESGYDPHKIVVCGIPLLDAPRRMLGDKDHRAAMWHRLGLPDDSGFLLFNVEPSYEHRYATHSDHWRRFHELMAAMRRTGMPVVLSLHPLCNIADYEFAEAEYGVAISRDYRIFDLYPYCRLSVSFPCSTNVVAEEFGKPLVIYDYFGMTAENGPRKDLFRLANARYGYTVEEVEREIAAVLSATPAGERRGHAAANACAVIIGDVEKRFALGHPPLAAEAPTGLPARAGAHVLNE
jgi:hypothetical protein